MKGRNNVAASAKGLPEFTYTGTYQTIDDGNDNWRIKFLTSGTFRMSKLKGAKKGIDVFLVGGGGGGGNSGGGLGAGGGGGYTKTVGNISVEKMTSYSVVVGAGGSARAGTGGASSAFGYSANGGTYKNGGSGGGEVANLYGQTAGKGGSNGGNGGNGKNNQGASITGGSGQGTSTREFWTIDQNTSATLYAGGGGGGAYQGTPNSGGDGGGGNGGTGSGGTVGTANTGGGGGGNNTGGKAGGSGIVIIRNTRG